MSHRYKNKTKQHSPKKFWELEPSYKVPGIDCIILILKIRYTQSYVLNPKVVMVMKN